MSTTAQSQFPKAWQGWASLTPNDPCEESHADLGYWTTEPHEALMSGTEEDVCNNYSKEFGLSPFQLHSEIRREIIRIVPVVLIEEKHYREMLDEIEAFRGSQKTKVVA